MIQDDTLIQDTRYRLQYSVYTMIQDVTLGYSEIQREVERYKGETEGPEDTENTERYKGIQGNTGYTVG